MRKQTYVFFEKIVLSLYNFLLLSWILFLLIGFFSVINIMGHFFLH